jgi:transposase
MMVYRWVQLQEAGKTGELAQPQRQALSTAKNMAPRHLAWLFLYDSRHLKQQEQQTLSLIRKVQNVDVVYELVQQFVTMVKARDATALDTWLWNCQTSGISDLVTFAASGWKRKGLLCTQPSHSPTAMGLWRETLRS